MFSLLLPLLVLVSQAYASIAFDFHYHFTNDGILYDLPKAKTSEFILGFQDKAQVKTTALISDSYRHTYVSGQTSSQDKRYQLQNELVNFLQENPKRFVGVCSIDITWPDVKEFARKCTTSDQIKGIKLHFDSKKQTLKDPLFRSKVNETLEALASKNIFYLIHMSFDQDASLEAYELFRLAAKFQRQNFIIAHAAEEYSHVLAELGSHFRKHPSLRQNIYAEISTVFSINSFFHGNSTENISNWRSFGMKYILFGSDFPISSAEAALDGLKNSGFSKSEIEGILNTNPEKFFHSIGN